MVSGWVWAALILAQAADIGTTAHALRHSSGCVETVWPTQRPWIIAGAKTAGVVLTIALAPKVPARLTVAIAATGIVSGVFGATKNLSSGCF